MPQLPHLVHVARPSGSVGTNCFLPCPRAAVIETGDVKRQVWYGYPSSWYRGLAAWYHPGPYLGGHGVEMWCLDMWQLRIGSAMLAAHWSGFR